MKSYDIAVIPGDGIGREITGEAVAALRRAGEAYGFSLHTEELLAGGCAIDETGVPLPDETLTVCRKSDSVLLGAVGGPKWDALPGDMRPERALLGLRSGLSLFTNLRPAVVHKPLIDASPLKREIIGDGLDVLVVRELTGGIYFGDHGRREGRYGAEAYDEMRYSVTEVERICRAAFRMARLRRRKVTSVDKANVLETSRLWRETFHRVSEEFPDVEADDMFVDNASMQLVRNPAQFDVIVTGNLFGDILSDEASMITGSIGMLPSASIGEGTLGMYEPVHGSAPDIAGRGIANPLAAISSAAMMLRYSLLEREAADAIDAAVENVLEKGMRTADLGGSASTREMGAAVCEQIG